ncbi:MAG: ThiF family adenylyltransferase [Phycisphaerales bacterium]|nr:ThiF family adenylyltransferase [Phycisphaerales bacterium]
MNVDMDKDDLSRYSRQSVLAEIGLDGQKRLHAAHAMIIGCGALGCPAADLLARAGVGLITILDRDVVEVTNLQRQTLFQQRDADERRAKATAAAERLRAVNPRVRVEAMVEDLRSDNIESILRPHPRPGVILDCADNYRARFLINDASVKLNIPLVYGGAVGTTGMSMTIMPGVSACLRCVFDQPPSDGAGQSCELSGILAPVSSMIGAVQASEAIKILCGRGDLASKSLFSVDLMRFAVRSVGLEGAKRADCPCCALGRFEFLDQDEGEQRVLCGRGAVQIAGGGPVDLSVLQRRLSRLARVTADEGVLHATLNNETVEGLTVFSDGRAIVRGTTDPAAARAAYIKYVGA